MEQPKRIDTRLNFGNVYHDELESRFTRLRRIMFNWENQIESIPRRVLELFDDENLPGIMSLMEEQRVLSARIDDLKKFIVKWETPGSGFMEVARYRDE